jgi:hypothetical protein
MENLRLIDMRNKIQRNKVKNKEISICYYLRNSKMHFKVQRSTQFVNKDK